MSQFNHTPRRARRASALLATIGMTIATVLVAARAGADELGVELRQRQRPRTGEREYRSARVTGAWWGASFSVWGNAERYVAAAGPEATGGELAGLLALTPAVALVAAVGGATDARFRAERLASAGGEWTVLPVGEPRIVVGARLTREEFSTLGIDAGKVALTLVGRDWRVTGEVGALSGRRAEATARDTSGHLWSIAAVTAVANGDAEVEVAHLRSCLATTTSCARHAQHYREISLRGSALLFDRLRLTASILVIDPGDLTSDGLSLVSGLGVTWRLR